jgi:hypothetical protein
LDFEEAAQELDLLGLFPRGTLLARPSQDPMHVLAGLAHLGFERRGGAARIDFALDVAFPLRRPFRRQCPASFQRLQDQPDRLPRAFQPAHPRQQPADVRGVQPLLGTARHPALGHEQLQYRLEGQPLLAAGEQTIAENR